ncbi:unnamed protein product, partial [marine sediment metagenome]
MPLFNRERKKGPVRDILLPRTTSLRPKDIFDAKFTYDQAMKEEGNPGPSPSTRPTKPSGASMAESKSSACVPCAKNHVSTISGVLNESVRFARKDG